VSGTGGSASWPRTAGPRRHLDSRRRGGGTGHGSGVDDGTRTRDPHLGKVMPYQLGHIHEPPPGVEPGTSSLPRKCSAVMSYGGKIPPVLGDSAGRPRLERGLCPGSRPGGSAIPPATIAGKRCQDGPLRQRAESLSFTVPGGRCLSLRRLPLASPRPGAPGLEPPPGATPGWPTLQGSPGRWTWRRRDHGGIRTRTGHVLGVLPLPGWATRPRARPRLLTVSCPRITCARAPVIPDAR
jgi:hypothetical protein